MCNLSIQYLRLVDTVRLGFWLQQPKKHCSVPQFFYQALTTADLYSKLIVTNTICGKKDTSYQTITIPARPVVNLGNDTVICTKGSSIVLNATSYAGSSYEWYFGATTPTITLSPNGTTIAICNSYL